MAPPSKRSWPSSTCLPLTAWLRRDVAGGQNPKNPPDPSARIRPRAFLVAATRTRRAPVYQPRLESRGPSCCALRPQRQLRTGLQRPFSLDVPHPSALQRCELFSFHLPAAAAEATGRASEKACPMHSAPLGRHACPRHATVWPRAPFQPCARRSRQATARAILHSEPVRACGATSCRRQAQPWRPTPPRTPFPCSSTKAVRFPGWEHGRLGFAYENTAAGALQSPLFPQHPPGTSLTVVSCQARPASTPAARNSAHCPFLLAAFDAAYTK